MKRPAQGRTPKKHVILFLAANPLDTDRAVLDREAREIQLELRRSGYRDRFEFVTWGAAEPLDLLRMLRERTPTVVHFSGHGARSAETTSRRPSRDVVADVAPDDAGAPGGVVFVGADGRGRVVTPAAFGQTLAAAGVQVRLVVLNVTTGVDGIHFHRDHRGPGDQGRSSVSAFAGSGKVLGRR